MKLIETVEAIQTSRAAASPAAGATRVARERPGASRPKTERVADIGAQRRHRRRDDDEEPPLPM